MANDYDCHEKALNVFNKIINGLKNDPGFYMLDISCEYTPFEESIKSYCDSYFKFYSVNDELEFFFNSLTVIVEAIVENGSEEYYEDFFRPAELLTYYFGKIISSAIKLKEDIKNWLADFCKDFKGDIIVDEYFKPFIDGKKIYHADIYYTDYDDFNMMIEVFK